MFKRIISIVLSFILFITPVFATPTLDLTAKSAYLIEESTGEVLYALNEHEQLRPASVTKVMTILLIMEAIDSGKISLDDMVGCSERARKMGGSQIWLNETEKLSVNDMLKAICVVSANDCCVAMSEFVAGSEEGFVEMMNARAKELGMNDTTFKNCHGIDEDGHVTSAHDIAVMSRELLKHKKIFDYTTIWMDTLRDGKSQLVNTNKLIRFYEGANGLKTGSTSISKYSLSATAKRNDMQLIGVIMCAPTGNDRFEDAKKLLDYGFANYSLVVLDDAGTSVGMTNVERGENEFVEGIIENKVTLLGPKGLNKNVERKVDFYTLKAPIEKGEKIGDITYIKDGTEIAKEDIIAANSVEKIKFLTIVNKLLDVWVKVGRE